LERRLAADDDVGLRAGLALLGEDCPRFGLDLLDKLGDAAQLGRREPLEELHLGQPLSSVIDLPPERHGVPLRACAGHRSAAALICSGVIGPARTMTGSDALRSTTVEASPTQSPPSMTSAMSPLRPAAASTALGGVGRPCRFALVTVSGPVRLAIS